MIQNVSRIEISRTCYWSPNCLATENHRVQNFVKIVRAEKFKITCSTIIFYFKDTFLLILILKYKSWNSV